MPSLNLTNVNRRNRCAGPAHPLESRSVSDLIAPTPCPTSRLTSRCRTSSSTIAEYGSTSLNQWASCIKAGCSRERKGVEPLHLVAQRRPEALHRRANTCVTDARDMTTSPRPNNGVHSAITMGRTDVQMLADNTRMDGRELTRADEMMRVECIQKMIAQSTKHGTDGEATRGTETEKRPRIEMIEVIPLGTGAMLGKDPLVIGNMQTLAGKGGRKGEMDVIASANAAQGGGKVDIGDHSLRSH